MASERSSYTLGQIDSPTPPQYAPGQFFLLPPPTYLPMSPMFTPGQFFLPTPPTFSPTSSPYWPTSLSYSPIYLSGDLSPPRWTPEAMPGSTPGRLWEELIPVERPVATNSIVDGTTLQGVEVINNTNNGDSTTNGVNNELNEVSIDGCSCSICYESCTSCGNHRICCLPCGHVYGFSCINKWLQLPQGSNKCPQCKRSCTLQDVRILFVTSQHTDAHKTSLKDIISHMEALKLSISATKQRDDALEKVPTELEQCVVDALENCVHAIEAIETSLQLVSIGTVRGYSLERRRNRLE